VHAARRRNEDVELAAHSVHVPILDYFAPRGLLVEEDAVLGTEVGMPGVSLLGGFPRRIRTFLIA
ncbi:MAG TPA: hypothetical protein VJ714_09595, partial [Anaerolineae bacterium]|nr:hypothetical protein [Anaerolineae bacterium]